MTSTGAARETVLSPIDVKFYRKHGWYIADDVFSHDDLSALNRAADAYWSGQRDVELDLSHLGAHLNWRPGDDGNLRLNDYAAQQLRAIGDVALSRALGAVAAALAETPEIRLFNSSLIYKPPGSAVVGWHTDKAYWPTCSSDNMLTAWIPLHDCPEEMGPITVLDGSHRWDGESLNDLRAGRTFISADPDRVAADLRKNAPEFETTPLALRAGQVSFHHCRTFHSSAPNRSGLPRRVLVLHLQDLANHYVEAREADGQPLIYKHDAIVRRDANGRPDYTDPVVCPRLWPTRDEV